MTSNRRASQHDRPRQSPAENRDDERRHKVRLGGREITLPRSRILRLGLGVAFIIGGVLGFLPIVGFWMLPLGVLILSYDLPFARRWRRRFVVWWNRRREQREREGDF